MQPVLELHGVTVAHATRAPVLEDVHLRLDRGFTGVVGENGAGKTTLLRVLAGELRPREGLVVGLDRARVACVPQESPHAREEVLAFAASWDKDAVLVRARLALEPDDVARWPTLSPGERQRWNVGAALAAAPDVLLLDEPTNHLDAEGRERLVGALRAFRGAAVLVSHDRALLDALATQVLRLHQGRARLYVGGYTAAREAWIAERRALEERHAAARHAERALAAQLDAARREHAAAVRGTSTRLRMKGPRDSDARGALAKGKAAMAEARTGQAVGALRSAHARAASAVPTMERDRTAGGAVFAGYARAPKPILFHLERDALRARGPDAPVVLRDVRVTISREDRVRVVGPNGAGKSTLLAALGEVGPPPSLMLVLPQELAPEGVAAHMATLRELPPEERGRVLSVFATLGSDPERLLPRLALARTAEATLELAASLSPGEARKLALALGLGRHAWALVLDEPENHLDLPTVERLERALELYPGCLVVVTHDDAFASACTRRVLRVEGGAVV